MLVENQPLARTDDRRKATLDECLSGLEILAGDGHAGLLSQLPHGGYVDRGIGGTHDEGGTLCQRRIGVAHRGSDVLAVVGLHGSLEGFERAMHLHVDRHIDFGGSRPEHHDARTAMLALEVAYVLTQRLDHLPSRVAWLDIVAIEPLGIVAVKGCRHGHHLLQLVAHGQDVLLLEHLGIHGSLEGVLGIDIPGAEDDVVELRQRHDV